MKTKQSHTPGPWAINESTGGGIEIDSVYPGNGEFVCTVHEGDHDIHNARLIAAAPEMLEALLMISQECAETPAVLSEAALGIIQMICRAAIAKAEAKS